jgi:hypothetical protein
MVVTRLDGWIGSNPSHAPRSVAEAIARTLPQLGDGDTVADVKARTIARQLKHERSQTSQRIVKRIRKRYHE